MTPTEIRLRSASRLLTVSFEDGASFDFTFEYLRVHSPSAEVRGHGPGQETLQTGKQGVAITAVEPVGHYAVRLVFDDGQLVRRLDSLVYTFHFAEGLRYIADGHYKNEDYRSYSQRRREELLAAGVDIDFTE